ncbi:hypothetical protein [Paraburkholderia sediminicola]|uniref:hypothetical protein n=1 Tax=Paraburkholderia sediminicola TaxID=458836 RepID=UPI0038B9A381
MFLSNANEATKVALREKLDGLWHAAMPKKPGRKFMPFAVAYLEACGLLIKGREFSLRELRCVEFEPADFAELLTRAFKGFGQSVNVEQLQNWSEVFGDVRMCDLRFAVDFCMLRNVDSHPTITAVRQCLSLHMEPATIKKPEPPKESAAEAFVRIDSEKRAARAVTRFQPQY